MGDGITIFSGWNQEVDLSKRNDLQWKIRYVMEESNKFCSVYIVQSNENHMLLINEGGIEKI